MALALADIHRIAQLARIQIDAAQAQAALAQLTDIFAMIAEMQAIDTTGVEPMAHPLGGSQRLRADVVTEPVDRDAYLGNAPAHEAGLFLVPRVIE
jgi:aspartyl-tRNA(Asn)/glutamyl-tRNA(Gln) amidotransferase subunit C